MDMNLILLSAAIVVIISLAFYAGILINKIKTQKAQALSIEQAQQQVIQQKIQDRNNNIVESIRFIARATMQKQCNLSEAAIRLTVLLETLQLSSAIDLAQSYPALTAMFDKVKDMPTHNERKNHPVKEIKILDMKREVFEAEMEAAIIEEATQLSQFSI